MLTRLTLTILNYATNDARQFDKRTKSVELDFHDGEGKDEIDYKVTATIPIDIPSRAVRTLEDTRYKAFASGGGSAMAELFEQAAEAFTIAKHAELYDAKDDLRRRAFWKYFAPNPSDKKPIADSKTADRALFWAEFAELKTEQPTAEEKKAFEILTTGTFDLSLVPTAELLTERILSTRNGNASDGLQQFGQRLSAANP